MDDIDRAIINEIQSDFPITSRPYHELGRNFNLSESEVIERVKILKAEGVIRRIGGNFHSKSLISRALFVLPRCRKIKWISLFRWSIVIRG